MGAVRATDTVATAAIAARRCDRHGVQDDDHGAGDCAAFDATAAAAALADDLSVTVDQITVVKNCGGERRRRLVEEFTLYVEVVARNDGVTSQVAGAAGSVTAGDRLHRHPPGGH